LIGELRETGDPCTNLSQPIVSKTDRCGSGIGYV